MCRGGPSGPLGHARSVGSLAARVLAVVAALMLAAGGAGARHASATGAEPGFVMVICSDGVAKTVVLDREGNPVEPSGESACLGLCLCCTVPEGDALSPGAQASAVWDPVARVEAFNVKSARLWSESSRSPQARGPPTEEDA